MQDLMTHKPDTESLVARAKRGDRAAWDELLALHRPQLLSQVRGRLSDRLRNRVDAEDILHDALCRAFEAIERFEWRGQDSFLAWIGAIAEHLILNATKKKELNALRLNQDVPQSGVSPGTVLGREERYERLKASVRSLTPDQRQAVLLAKIDGLAAREIASRMGRSEDAVRQLLSRALRQLKNSLDETGSLRLPDRHLGDEDLSND